MVVRLAWRPRLVHVEIALEFVEHLIQALLHGFGADGAEDPADVVGLLGGGSPGVGFGQAT